METTSTTRARTALRGILVFLLIGAFVLGTIPLTARAQSQTGNAIPAAESGAPEPPQEDGDSPAEAPGILPSHVADDSTAGAYRNILGGSENGGRYAGRIWTDKSVFVDAIPQLDTEVVPAQGSLPNGPLAPGEDFGVVYSTLGSSRVINGEATTPIDLVLMLDISSSMCTNGSELSDGRYPIDRLVEATNDLMEEFLDLNSQNRVGIVVYGGGSQELLPLGRYTKNGSAPFIQLGPYEQNIDKGTWYQRFYSLTANTKESGSRTSAIMNGNATYLQGALYQGMNMLVLSCLSSCAVPAGQNTSEIQRLSGSYGTLIAHGFKPSSTSDRRPDHLCGRA